jgi:hypothetical protein
VPGGVIHKAFPDTASMGCVHSRCVPNPRFAPPAVDLFDVPTDLASMPSARHARETRRYWRFAPQTCGLGLSRCRASL